MKPCSLAGKVVWAAGVLAFWVSTMSVLPRAGQAQAPLPEALAGAVVRQKFPLDSVSVFVQAVDAARPLVAWRTAVPRNPASVMKLVTVAAALDRLGPDYQWPTEVYVEKTPVAGGLSGHLYIKGYGDPFMTPEFFWRLVFRVQNMGLNRISGDVVVDDSYFAVPERDRGAFDGRPLRPYNAAASAVLVNFQAFEFHFVPTAQGKVRIRTYPESPLLDIKNQVAVVDARCQRWQDRLRLEVKPGRRSVQVMIAGQYPHACGHRTMYRVVSDPFAFFAGLFQDLWSERGGSLAGQVRRGTVPEQAQLFYRGLSLPLADIVRRINKFSNNVMARQLFLTLAAQLKGAPGTPAKGIAAVTSWLGGQGISTAGLVVDNGAGLSRRTRISAEAMGQLLLHSYHQPYMPEFVSSLAIMGVDGTLADRLEHAELVGRVHAKTGLLNEVRALAGYVLSTRGRRYVVVLFINHPEAHSLRGEQLQNDVLAWVYRH